MAAENNDSRRIFTADGETYEYPDPFDLDLDEWVIIYDETGLILEDFAPFEDKASPSPQILRLEKELDGMDEKDEGRSAVFQKLQVATASNALRDGPNEKKRQQSLRNPALIKALAICGILRAKPEWTVDAARELAGDMKMLAVLVALAGGDDDVDDPTQDSQSETDDSSPTTSDTSNGSTSPDSPSSSDEQASEPATTGTSG